MPELEGPPLPVALAYLWGWFTELASARGGNGLGGVNPIGYAEMDAWARLRALDPTPFEIDVLRRLDQSYLTILADHGRHRSRH